MRREEIVARAREWINTPFVDQGRVQGEGVDCAGIVEMVPKSLGAYADAVIKPYSRNPDPVRMRAELEKHLDVIGFKYLLPADIIWFRVERQPQHLGIITEVEPDLRMVHASNVASVMKVVETGVSSYWKKRVQGCYRYRGIEE